MSEVNQALADKILGLKKAYVEKLKATIVDLKNFSAQKDLDVVEEVYKEVHKISGTSGMYGLSGISQISTAFEIYLKDNKFKKINMNDFDIKFEEYIVGLEKQLDS